MQNDPNPNNIDPNVAYRELWRRAQLSFLLDDCQKQLYDEFYASKFKISTWLLSRRQGKTYLLCILALEQCIKQSNSIVKFVSPTKMQVSQNVRPILRQILENCPEDIKPDFKSKDYIYYFPNGSELQLAGSDNGHAERLRGGDSHLFFVDEAGSCSELENLLKSILLPTTLITKGRGILASTPPKESEHEFLDYIEEAELNNSLTIRTIDDNPRITAEQKQELINELGGPDSEETLRELYCKIIKNAATSVIPEFDSKLEKEIVKEWPKPPFFDAYEAMDTGGKDFTVILYGYYDYRSDKVIIEDETVIDFQNKDQDVRQLAVEIHKKEKELWTHPISGEYRPPTSRVSDIDYIFLNEIRQQSIKLNHKPEEIIIFNNAKKDNKFAAINNLRVLLNSKKIIIHPKCKTLVSHLNNVKWNKSKSEFARSKDNGHYDAVDALIYFVRHVAFGRNPYPPGFNLDMKNMYIKDPESFKKRMDTQMENLKIIFNIPKKRKW